MTETGPYERRADHNGRTPMPAQSVEASGYRHTFTYGGGGSTLRTDLVDLIDGARHKVFVAAWLIGDEEFLDALYRCADRLRGGVYVLAAMNERDLLRALRESDVEEDPRELMIRRKRFEDLTSRGIAVRTLAGCHAKFVVVDDRKALISSANFDPNALDRNCENGVVVEDAHQAERTARLFARLWGACQKQMPLSGDPVLTDVKEVAAAVTLDEPEPDSLGLIWTWDEEQHIRRTIQDVIGLAERELLLATWSLNGMTKRPDLLVDPLRAAIDKGVEVRMLLRNRPGEEHLRDARVLQDMGVRLYPCSRNHAKGVIADRQRGALFSANFDAAHGLTADIEVGVRLDGTPALREALRFFEHAIAEHDFDLPPLPSIVAEVPAPRSHDRIGIEP
jgi:phosphatidylserine/phosphatidylglycerophosphate/cardiolipin synthase-like enzyme